MYVCVRARAHARARATHIIITIDITRVFSRQARNEEKAQSMLSRFRQQKKLELEGEQER